MKPIYPILIIWLTILAIGARAQEDPFDLNDVEFELQLEQQFEELNEQLLRILGDGIDGPIVIQDEEILEGGLDARLFGGMVGLRSNQMSSLSHGAVKTDSDSEALLARAEEFAKQDRFDLASTLWQKVIDQSSDVLMERPDWKQRTFKGHEYQQFRPMIAEIEASMARAAADGLTSYQLQVDGEARALLALSKPSERENALSEIIRRYFLSSLGDDAAFELGCLKMERMEFFPAVRLFTKILDEYPNPTVPKEQIEIRLAGSLARVGAADQALEIVDSLYEEHPDLRRVLRLVRADIEEVKATQGSAASSMADSLTTPLNVQSSMGVGPLPEKLSILWQQPFDLLLPEDWPVLPESPRDPLPKVPPRRNVRGPNQQPPAPPNPLQRWRQFRFQPAGEMLIQNGLAFFRTDDRLAVCQTGNGELQWLGFRNRFALDANSTQRSRSFASTTNAQSPYLLNAEEFLVFGDSLNQSMTLTGDTLYVLQGEPLDFEEAGRIKRSIVPQARPRMTYNRRLAGRGRANRLVAYDVPTGKVKWYREANDQQNPNDIVLENTGFARAPLTYGSLLLAPVHQDAALWLYGMNASTGETLWKTFLCDEPPGQCEALSPVALAISAGDAYIASGAGYVFSIDAISGALNWAAQYPRTRARTLNAVSPTYNSSGVALDGWHQDRLVPYGNHLIISGSDFNFLFALNRRTGKLSWEAAKRPFRSQNASRYLLGIQDGRVYTGGVNTFRCYQASGGKMLWERRMNDCFGRAALTPEAVYVPQEKGIAQLDAKTGRVITVSQVETPHEDEPVGNLFTDGSRFLVYGLKKIYALGVPGADNPTDVNES